MASQGRDRTNLVPEVQIAVLEPTEKKQGSQGGEIAVRLFPGSSLALMDRLVALVAECVRSSQSISSHLTSRSESNFLKLERK
jgi:hypothetical protein